MKRTAPAAERNRGPILEALRPRLPAEGVLLEVASGTGQHAVHLAQHCPTLTIQPTEVGAEALASIQAWKAEAGLENLLAPLALDASADEWPVEHADAVFNANMIHIAPWAATTGLFAGAGRVLKPGGRLFTYGPYLVNGRPTTESNAAFHASLQSKDPRWGIRDVDAVRELARRHGLELAEQLAMPANNFLLVFDRI